jgi:hypothetical protein
MPILHVIAYLHIMYKGDHNVKTSSLQPSLSYVLLLVN